MRCAAWTLTVVRVRVGLRDRDRDRDRVRAVWTLTVVIAEEVFLRIRGEAHALVEAKGGRVDRFHVERRIFTVCP